MSDGDASVSGEALALARGMGEMLTRPRWGCQALGLALASSPSLVDLSLASNPLADEGVSRLCHALWSDSLTTATGAHWRCGLLCLHLGGTGVADATAHACAEVRPRYARVASERARWAPAPRLGQWVS